MRKIRKRKLLMKAAFAFVGILIRSDFVATFRNGFIVSKEFVFLPHFYDSPSDNENVFLSHLARQPQTLIEIWRTKTNSGVGDDV